MKISHFLELNMDFSSTGVMLARENFMRLYGLEPNVVVISPIYRDQIIRGHVLKLLNENGMFYPAIVTDMNFANGEWGVGCFKLDESYPLLGSRGE